jgi:hypothetical protein
MKTPTVIALAAESQAAAPDGQGRPSAELHIILEPAVWWEPSEITIVYVTLG